MTAPFDADPLVLFARPVPPLDTDPAVLFAEPVVLFAEPVVLFAEPVVLLAEPVALFADPVCEGEDVTVFEATDWSSFSKSLVVGALKGTTVPVVASVSGLAADIVVRGVA